MKQTSLRENRPLAWLALVLAVVIGVFGFGSSQLKRLGSDATKYYETHLAADMALRMNAAKAIVQVGESVLDKKDTALVAAQDALRAMEQADTPKKALTANTNLTSAVGMLYETLHKVQGSDKGSVLQGQWSEFTSRQNIMNNGMDGYTQAAQKAQDAVKGFPASLLARLVGMPV